MKKSKNLGVVIGRFQIPELHEGHIGLLDQVAARHEQLLILVGHNTIRFNTDDPFPFLLRKQMLESRYPRATILPLLDSPVSNEHWSTVVDGKVASVSENGKAVLYGSRDSFIPKYLGRYPTQELPELSDVSATQVRALIGSEIVDDPLFRKGWLSAVHSQYPVTDPTVDMAIHTADFSQVLLGRRGKGSPLRFFGGFVDPEDDSCELAAGRERVEEAMGITVAAPQYIASQRIKDPRYGKGKYGVMTTFFAMEFQTGTPEAGDDMGLTEWCDLNEQLLELVAPEHVVLVQLLLDYKQKRLAI
jgi:bifunctional NMN adenylyltransferase/nudix hydrolase